MKTITVQEGLRELFRDYADEISKFLLENGMDKLEKVIVPWRALLEAAYKKGVTVGEVVAYTDMASHVAGKTGRYTVIGLNTVDLEEPELTVPKPKPRRGRKKRR